MVEGHNYSNLWLAGDFNLGDIIWESQSVRQGAPKPSLCRDLIDISNDYGLEQLVELPTRGDNVLDLFFTSNPSLVSKSTVMPGISDHDGIPMLIVDSKPITTKQKPRKVYLYHKADVETLKVEASKINETIMAYKVDNTSDVNTLWVDLKNDLHEAVDNCVPSKVVNKTHNTPWINQKLKRLHKRKQRAYNRARKSGSQEDWDKYRELRKKIKKDSRKAYRKYISEKCFESTKQFWSFVKSLKKDSSGIPALKDLETGELITDSKAKANLLNKQYQQQFTQERLQDFPSEPESSIPDMPEIYIQEEGVRELLSNLHPFKAAGPDNISPWTLKQVADELSPALTKIFQLSLDTGVVPEDWLCANITPIFKKGDKTKPSNYRSVNLTSVCSKVFEHILHTNIMHHLDQHNILCNEQHGFRRGHSCETQLISTVHDIASELDKKHQIDMIVMDFQKAFDKVPHKRLILKLNRYGIRGKTLNWIENFLTQRKQRVVVEGDYSEWVRVESSVPQGTVTGPLYFLLFINDLPDGIKGHVRLFADDCILYNTIAGPEDASRLQSDLDTLTSWQNRWQMDFNAQKCFVLHFSHARSPKIYDYSLNNTILQETQSHAYLGVDLSHNLTWNSHINKISAKANRCLGFLRRNLASCSQSIKDMAYKTLIRPVLDYCSSVWDPYTQNLTNQLEAVQNRAARFVCKDYSRHSSVTSMKKSFGWETLQTRRTTTRLSHFQQATAGQLAIPVSATKRPARRNLRNTSVNTNSYLNQ